MLDIRTGDVTNDAIQFANEGLSIIKLSKDGEIMLLDDEEEVLASIDDADTLKAFIKALEYSVKNKWLKGEE